LWSIGKYDENRVIYTQPLFGGSRTVHIGIDIGGPVYVSVHAFTAGKVIHSGINPLDGDYGPVIVVEHKLGAKPIYALYGHLSSGSVRHSPVGRSVEKGDVLGWLGPPSENGGWPPHVHFQLSWERPDTHDMPGAVSLKDRFEALLRYPDPRMVLGNIYED
jgi:murein DD-endopeptidase MepM/ murein hydrolase activator NlpD